MAGLDPAIQDTVLLAETSQWIAGSSAAMSSAAMTTGRESLNDADSRVL
jgi:hypothetical protein